jgi:hypothetical protein
VRQFDIVTARDGFTYCVLQANFVLDRPFVMLAPTDPQKDDPATPLTPRVMIDGTPHLVDVNQQIAVKHASLPRVAVVRLNADEGEAIKNALNLLYWGI